MKKFLRVSRGLQLLGAAVWVASIASCANQGDPRAISWMWFGGFMLIIAAKTYEWMGKE